jgi:hypothetical protein
LTSIPENTVGFKRFKNIRDVYLDPTKYNIESILMMFDTEKLLQLKEQFEVIISRDIATL